MHIVIFGKYNIISIALVELIMLEGHTFDLLCYQDLNLSRPRATIKLNQTFSKQPDAIIFVDEYNNINILEQNFYTSLQVNSLIPTILANYAATNNIPFVYYSSKRVFACEDGIVYEEESEPKPSTYYGMSKLLGEIAIKNSGCKYLILRKSFVFKPYLADFIHKILRKAMTNEILSAINDQLYYPTSADYIAKVTMQLISQQFWNNTVHIAGFPAITPYKFTKYIVDLAIKQNIKITATDVAPVKTEFFNNGLTTNFSVFSCNKLLNICNIPVEFWIDKLNKIDLKYYL
jgi:dTDP-4-dehydrorhamnose reductase